MDSGQLFSFVHGLYLDMHLFALHLLFDFEILNKAKRFIGNHLIFYSETFLSLCLFFFFPSGTKMNAKWFPFIYRYELEQLIYSWWPRTE